MIFIKNKAYILNTVIILSLIIFVIFLLMFIYIRIKFRFWALQPVHHVYDMFYYFFPPGIINFSLPEKNRYCNFKDIETLDFQYLEDFKREKFVNFINKHFLRNNENIFSPKKENIIPYFTSHNTSCFFSFYYNNEPLVENKTNETVLNKRIIGVMTTKPVNIFINNGNKDAIFDAYLVDYLCVDKSYRKKGIAQEIIQTHHYNQSYANKKIKVSLFKREGEITGIIPLCVYHSYAFDTSIWDKPKRLNPKIALIEINKTNIYHLIDFIKLNKTNFDIVISTDVSNLLELIKSSNVVCYIVNETTSHNILCVYFFKKTCTFIQKEVEMISCFASINCCKKKDVFIMGYKLALYKIKKRNLTFRVNLIENISDNNIIIDNILVNSQPMFKSITGWFFYNFAYKTFNSNKCLIIE